MAEQLSPILALFERPNRFIEQLLLVLGRITPSKLSAWFIFRYIPVAVAANLSLKFPAQKVASIADHLPSVYLVDLSLSLNAESARYLLPEISPATSSRIARQLVDQREFVAISRLVAYLAPAAMAHAVYEIQSPSDLLKVAAEIDEKHLLSPAIIGLPSERLGSLLVAAENGAYWQVVFDIVSAMDEATQRQLGERLAEVPAQELTAFLHASLAFGAWPELLRICLDMSEHAQRQLAEKISEQAEDLHLKFMLQAKEQGQMQVLLKLVSAMPMPAQRRLVRMAGRHGIRITSAL